MTEHENETAINERLGAVGMIAEGYLVPVCNWIGPGRSFDYSVFMALKPQRVAGPDGERDLDVGDVLAVDEVEHSGAAIRAQVLRGEVAELDATSGIVAKFNALDFRCHQLERLIRDTFADEGEAA